MMVSLIGKNTVRSKQVKNLDGVHRTYRQWKSLLAGCLAHITHDGYSDTLYVFLPLWQSQFGLTFAEVGFFKTLFSGTMALFQVPSGHFAARIGEVRLLLGGSVLTCLSVWLIGWAYAPIMLGILLVLGGFGSAVQHPISSSIISHAYPEEKDRRKALSLFNFAGDVGKVAFPGIAAFIISLSNWQTASKILALSGLALTAVVFVVTRNIQQGSQEQTEKKPSGMLLGWSGYQPFWSLSAIGILDSATRMGFLTFFPFLLIEKGADISLVGLSLTLVFAGGATGKLACGMLATRVGILRSVIVTETVTALSIGSILFLPLWPSIALAPLVGIVLNGTSSVLYGSVPELVPMEKRNQAFAIFYTATIGSSAISPVVYGFAGDLVGITTAVSVVAAVVLLTLPLTALLRGKLAC